MAHQTKAPLEQGRWGEIRASIQSHWNRLTDEDLEAIGGHLHELEGQVQKRYGWPKEKVRESVSGFLRSVKISL